MRKKILHFRVWAAPPISASVVTLLKDCFPEFDLEVVTLWDVIKSKKRVIFYNSLATLKEYGKEIIFGRLEPRAAFFRTTYLFDYVCSLVKDLSRDKKNIVFTFQLQSIFDTHLEGIPNFVYTDHTHLANLQYSPAIKVNLYSAEWICREKTIYDNACCIFTRSTNISRSLIEQYGEPVEKVKCVYAGANTPMISIDPEKKDYSGKNILFVGLDWERKGGPELVEAFLRINEKHPDATLTIVGNPPEFKKPGIISAGRVPVDRLNDYYREATVFCMPSHNEPFGIVFVEAMVHALPIVATNIGAIPDMVKPKKNGILVEAGDAEGLANALDELISSESNRRQFGRQSYLLSKKYYNWQAVGRKMRHAILSVVKE